MPVILIHGSWHGSWCWSPVVEQLAALGVPSVALDLDGHGLRNPAPRAYGTRPFDRAAFEAEPSPVAHVTVSSAAADLMDRIRMIGGGRPCLLVAHSMGGTVATAVAELDPELVGGLVYVAAYAPVSGTPAGEYNARPEMSDSHVPSLVVGDPAGVGALRVDPRDPDRRAGIKEAFYNDVDDRTADAAIDLLSPDSPLQILSETMTVTGHRFGSIPHAYVVCTLDNAIPPAMQRRFVKEIDAVSVSPTTVTELEASHAPFLSRPEALAGAIAAAATKPYDLVGN
ncbi:MULTISPECIES: alpha/beta fold hydrolase [Streptomyces]|uniref:alpha/beta fold hydrolase n=1 Tax=Streptomyces TaxID=1883 RepID=UPI003680B535